LRQISDRVFHWLTPRLGRRVGMEQDYQYLVKSTDAFLDAASLSARLRAAGFDQIRVRTFMFGHIALHIAQKS
jgi:ubiquinone/menaquinone biosynthesis C-methylase UbiE